MTLVWQPQVTVIGQTQFDVEGLATWMTYNGLEKHQSYPGDSPLGLLWQDVSDEYALERMVEFGGRHCYRSWEQGRDRFEYIRNVIDMGHGSVLEHSSVNLAVQGVSRSLSHELVRHRVGVAISQESQRFVSADGIEFVVPPLVVFLDDVAATHDFQTACEMARVEYKMLQAMLFTKLKAKYLGVKAVTLLKKRANEAARAHLPNAAETRLLWTPNLRLLRHFLFLRGGEGADLEIRRLAVKILEVVSPRAPAVFNDMVLREGEYGVPVIVSAEA